MERSAAVALTKKALSLAAVRGEIYPKVSLIIGDNTLVFHTSRHILWSGVDPSTVKTHVDEASKAVSGAADAFLKKAKAAGEPGEKIMQGRNPGRTAMNATKYPGVAQASYVWYYHHGVDDAMTKAAIKIGKEMKLIVDADGGLDKEGWPKNF